MKKKKMYNPEANTPKVELDQRIDNLKTHLRENTIDAVLISQRADLFYFSGTIQQANLYIPATGEPILFAIKSTERAMAESSIDRIVPLNSSKKIPEILIQNGYDIPRTLGLELDVLPTALYFTYRKLFSDTDIRDISLAIRLQRAVKSDYEIGLMRRAAKFSDQVLGWVPNILRQGITEIEMASDGNVPLSGLDVFIQRPFLKVEIPG